MLAKMKVYGEKNRINEVLEIAFTTGSLAALAEVPDAGF